MKRKIGIISVFLLLLVLSSCVAVKPYQKAYLSDDKMALSPPSIESFETTFQIYREGASGASSGKTGGGCGCN